MVLKRLSCSIMPYEAKGKAKTKNCLRLTTPFFSQKKKTLDYNMYRLYILVET